MSPATGTMRVRRARTTASRRRRSNTTCGRSFLPSDRPAIRAVLRSSRPGGSSSRSGVATPALDSPQRGRTRVRGRHSSSNRSKPRVFGFAPRSREVASICPSGAGRRRSISSSTSCSARHGRTTERTGFTGWPGAAKSRWDTEGQDLQWWFTQELAATALTPLRSWEHVTGADSALPAEALQDLATAAEVERLWRRPEHGGMNPRQGASARGALLTLDDDGRTRLDSRIAPGPDDRTYTFDWGPFRSATRTVPLTLDLTCHGYDEGETRAYNCIPEPSQQHLHADVRSSGWIGLRWG